MSKSLGSGPLPGTGIDCRVQRMALALRYHYGSIDQPALKSKSHLVAQAIISESGDQEIYVYSGRYVQQDRELIYFCCLYSLVCFPRLLFGSTLILSLPTSTSPFSVLILLPLPLSFPLPHFHR